MARLMGIAMALSLLLCLAPLHRSQAASVRDAPPTLRMYTVTDLGSLGGGNTSPVAINDQGQVVGSSSTATGQNHAFVWSSDTGMDDLGTLPGDISSLADGINSQEQIVGASYSATGVQRGVLWYGGTASAIGPLSPSTTPLVWADAINDAGHIVGGSTISIDNGVPTHAYFLSQGAGMQDLGVLPGCPSSCQSSATAINQSDQIVGWSDTPSANLHAVLWNNATQITDLGTLDGDPSASATAINNKGQVVGQSSYPDPSTAQVIYRAFLWTPGSGMTQLFGLPGSQFTTPNGINDSGQIVGSSGDFLQMHRRAMLWSTDGTATDLNTQIDTALPADSQWVLQDALAINNEGQIVGSGTHNGSPAGFLLQRCETSLTNNLTTCGMQPGDILLEYNDPSTSVVYQGERLSGEADGFWEHVGIYVGNNQVVESYPDPHGLPFVTTTPGVVQHDISTSSFWTARYFLVLRLKPNPNDLSKAHESAVLAMNQVGKPYNWNYLDKTRTDAFYCSQLIWFAYMNSAMYPVDLESRKSLCERTFGPSCWTAVTSDDIAFTAGDTTDVVQTNQPLHAAVFEASSGAGLYLTDPSGRHVGFDPASGQVINQMPDVANVSTASNGLMTVAVGDLEGSWTVGVVGQSSGAYTLASQSMSDSTQNTVVNGTIQAGQVLSYPVTAPGQLPAAPLPSATPTTAPSATPPPTPVPPSATPTSPPPAPPTSTPAAAGTTTPTTTTAPATAPAPASTATATLPPAPGLPAGPTATPAAGVRLKTRRPQSHRSVRRPTCRSRARVPLALPRLPRSVTSGSPLLVQLRTAKNARVSVLLQVVATKRITIGRGHHRHQVRRAIVLYHAQAYGSATKQGRVTIRLLVRYRTTTTAPARLAVTAQLGCASTTLQRSGITIRPHLQHTTHTKHTKHKKAPR